MKSIWKLLSSSFNEGGRGIGRRWRDKRIRGGRGFLVSRDTAITCWALSDHKGMAGNIYLFRDTGQAGDTILTKAWGCLQIPRDLFCPAHLCLLAHVPACPGPPCSTFSKSMGYILNPGSFSGLGSVALSSSRRLSSAGREEHLSAL